MEKVIAIAFCVFVASIQGCITIVNHQDTKAISEMVKGGADPIDARCAIKNEGNATMCAIRSSRK